VLNITGSYKHKQLIQQLVRSLEIRVKNTQTIKKTIDIVSRSYVVPVDLFLVSEDAHQFRNGNRRMSVVQLNSNL